jgi:uroporphyrinogen decarboxylase
MRLFDEALKKQNQSRPPVWFMRQAGRYHSHYQELRKKYSFTQLCKVPELACETTMGPIRDFDFDAAILFSDILFPLEAMGMGLEYDEGPKLDWHLKDVSDLRKLQGGESLASYLQFQADAMRLIRKALPQEKGLLGFVGGPLTLYCYAVEGSHQGSLNSSREGMNDGRFSGFCDLLINLLAENMAMQAREGASTIAVLDTCAGEFDPETYGQYIVPQLKILFERFKQKCPHTPLFYYSKGTSELHWEKLIDLPFEGLGVDWRHSMPKVLTQWGKYWAIQGNVDPHALFMDSKDLEVLLREFFQSILDLPQEVRRGWVCGLGHGVLPKTPEQSVRLFLKLQKEYFGVQTSTPGCEGLKSELGSDSSSFTTQGLSKMGSA